MALIKDYSTNFGVVANYHRLLKVEIDGVKKEVIMMTAIYASEEARTEGSNPLWHEYVTIPFNRLSVDPRDQFYPLLKTWAPSYVQGATDSLPSGITPVPTIFEILPPPPPQEGN